MSLNSGRRWQRSLSSPKSTSVWIVRSCASSSMTALYRLRSLFMRYSRSSMPSVMYLMTVSGVVWSSKRIV